MLIIYQTLCLVLTRSTNTASGWLRPDSPRLSLTSALSLSKALTPPTPFPFLRQAPSATPKLFLPVTQLFLSTFLPKSLWCVQIAVCERDNGGRILSTSRIKLAQNYAPPSRVSPPIQEGPSGRPAFPTVTLRLPSLSWTGDGWDGSRCESSSLAALLGHRSAPISSSAGGVTAVRTLSFSYRKVCWAGANERNQPIKNALTAGLGRPGVCQNFLLVV